MTLPTIMPEYEYCMVTQSDCMESGKSLSSPPTESPSIAGLTLIITILFILLIPFLSMMRLSFKSPTITTSEEIEKAPSTTTMSNTTVVNEEPLNIATKTTKNENDDNNQFDFTSEMLLTQQLPTASKTQDNDNDNKDVVPSGLDDQTNARIMRDKNNNNNDEANYNDIEKIKESYRNVCNCSQRTMFATRMFGNAESIFNMGTGQCFHKS